jgi:hypothetical protein
VSAHIKFAGKHTIALYDDSTLLGLLYHDTESGRRWLVFDMRTEDMHVPPASEHDNEADARAALMEFADGKPFL